MSYLQLQFITRDNKFDSALHTTAVVLNNTCCMAINIIKKYGAVEQHQQ